jgi:hypothetical protein
MCAALGLSAGAALAQDDKFATVFAFSTNAVDGNLTDAELFKAGGSDRLRPRANGVTVYHLYVKNATAEDASFVVEIDGGVMASVVVADVEVGKWKRVKFAAAPPVPAPVVPPPAPGAAVSEPTPAGKELAVKDGSFPLSFKLLDKNRKPLKPAIPSELRAAVILAEPASYVADKDRTATVTQDLVRATFGFTAPKDTKPLLLETPAKLALSFPRFGNEPSLFLRDAFPVRTLSTETPTPTLSARLGGYGTALLAHVAVDGVERAFIYRVFPTLTGNRQFEKVTAVAGRVFPTTADVILKPTKPVAAFPVRVEVDNAKAGDELELHVRRAGASEDETEVINLGGPRQERVWVLAGEPTGQGLAFATRSRDWVYPLNLTAVRGRIEVTPVLKPTAIPTGNATPLTLIVDDTPPDVTAIRFTNLVEETRLEKGKPLRVAATIRELDTGTATAVFLLGQPGEDGKPTPDAVRVIGRRVATDPKDKPDPLSSVWTAALPLPTDKRGELTLWVSATDDAENTGLSRPQRIELVDGPPPGPKPGKIAGVVCYAERPQPGMTVNLEADGKPKGTTKTDENGRFTFDKLPPGAYTVSTTRTNYSTGLAGVAEVAVEPGQTVKPLVTLKKLPPR